MELSFEEVFSLGNAAPVNIDTGSDAIVGLELLFSGTVVWDKSGVVSDTLGKTTDCVTFELVFTDEMLGAVIPSVFEVEIVGEILGVGIVGEMLGVVTPSV